MNCQDCGTRLRVSDNNEGGGITFRKLACLCGSRFESEEKITRRLPSATGIRPPVDQIRPPGTQIPSPAAVGAPADGRGVGGGLPEIPPVRNPDLDPSLLVNPNRARERRRVETPAFAAFYDRFPRKKKRPQALGAWIKQGCEAVAEAVMKGLETAMPELMRREPDKVPHPATWLNGREWEDPAPALKPVDSRCYWHKRGAWTYGKVPMSGPEPGCPECKHAQAARGERKSEPTPLLDALPKWMGEPATAEQLEELRRGNGRG